MELGLPFSPFPRIHTEDPLCLPPKSQRQASFCFLTSWQSQSLGSSKEPGRVIPEHLDGCPRPEGGYLKSLGRHCEPRPQPCLIPPLPLQTCWTLGSVPRVHRTSRTLVRLIPPTTSFHHRVKSQLTKGQWNWRPFLSFRTNT